MPANHQPGTSFRSTSKRWTLAEDAYLYEEFQGHDKHGAHTGVAGSEYERIAEEWPFDGPRRTPSAIKARIKLLEKCGAWEAFQSYEIALVYAGGANAH